MKSLLLFSIGALLFGAVSLGAGFFICEPKTLVQGLAAFALAFVPAVCTLAWVNFSFHVPEMQLVASLGGSGIRMVIALGGGLLLTSSQPGAFDKVFWSWLVLFYLALLGFEITLLVWRQPIVGQALQPDSQAGKPDLK